MCLPQPGSAGGSAESRSQSSGSGKPARRPTKFVFEMPPLDEEDEEDGHAEMLTWIVGSLMNGGAVVDAARAAVCLSAQCIAVYDILHPFCAQRGFCFIWKPPVRRWVGGKLKFKARPTLPWGVPWAGTPRHADLAPRWGG